MIATVLILLAAVTAVEAGRVIRDARRVRRMNRAMHELRRPLQAMALSLESASPDLAGAEACLDQARGALRELDSVVNGGPRPQPRPVRWAAVADVLDALEHRWRFADVAVERGGGAIAIEADQTRLAAALDNLVANALRHGSGVVRVGVRITGNRVRFEVRDGGPSPEPAAPKRPADPRHGHGLHVVADVAASHGGELVAARPARDGGTLAAISLPLAGEALGA
jgi:signal transduction histidine kinase